MGRIGLCTDDPGFLAKVRAIQAPGWLDLRIPRAPFLPLSPPVLHSLIIPIHSSSNFLFHHLDYLILERAPSSPILTT